MQQGGTPYVAGGGFVDPRNVALDRFTRGEVGHVMPEQSQLERLHSEDTPRRPMITHTIDQFILNPKSILLTSSYQIPSQNKMKAEKFAKN